MNKDQDQTRFAFVTGGVLSGIGTGEIINAIELVNQSFWIGVQFHPEFKSRPDSPHPLYLGLIRAALEHKNQRGKT
ncbi:MAG: glutamine amidotransferase-related protein [Candidatus Thorarchaeota archaeon]